MPVTDAEGVGAAVGVKVPLRLPVAVRVPERVTVLLGEPVDDRVGVPAAVGRFEGVLEAVFHTLSDAEAV